MKKSQLLLTILVILALVAGAARLVKMKKAALEKTPPPPKVPLPVKTALVKKGRLEIREHYLGTIRPLRSASLSTKLTGYLLKVTKYEGDPVKKGELLVEIEAKGLLTRLATLKAELNAAQSDLLTREAILRRNQKLLAHEAISQEAFDLSKSAFELAKARVVQLRQEMAAVKADLTYARITAPFSGVVTKRFKDPGDLATPGTPILELEDPQAGYRVLVKIPQEKAGLLARGTKAYLTLGKRRQAARVFRVHPAVGEEALATAEIRLKERPFGLPSGASVGVDLVFKEPEGFVLPLKALVPGKNPAVYVVREERLVLVPVEVLGQSADQVVLKGKLVPGEPVVVGDPGLLLRLHPGQRVITRGS